MILYAFVEVFFDGFVLMLSILSVMRGLYAFGVCQRPQSSADHLPQIFWERFESQTNTTVRTAAECDRRIGPESAGVQRRRIISVPRAG